MAETAQARAAKLERREEARKRLRKALLEVSREVPFRELRIEQIAGAAGLSRSAFYFYYSDKHELLAEATAEVVERAYAAATGWWSDEVGGREGIAIALQGVIHLWAENADLFRLTVEVATYDPEIEEMWRGLNKRFIDSTAEYLAFEQKRDRIDPTLDPCGAAEAMVWGIERCIYVYVATGDREPDEVVEILAGLWMRLLYPEPS